MAKRYIFRADASNSLGAGHIMRILVLAEEALSRGIKCILIGSIKDMQWLVTSIHNIGFSEIYSDDLNFVSNPEEDILVIDSYTISKNSTFLSPANWKYIVCIFDSDTPFYNADMYIVPSAKNLALLPSSKLILSGFEYQLIRKSISKNRNFKKYNLKIIISCGGSDQYNLTQELLNMLEKIDHKNEIHVFSNRAYLVNGRDKIYVYKNGNEYDQVANQADIAITTASTSALEFLAREIPIGVVCVSSNQKEYYDELTNSLLAVPIGELNLSNNWDLDFENIAKIIIDNSFRFRLKTRMFNLIDGNGAQRILNRIEKELIQNIDSNA